MATKKNDGLPWQKYEGILNNTPDNAPDNANGGGSTQQGKTPIKNGFYNTLLNSPEAQNIARQAYGVATQKQEEKKTTPSAYDTLDNIYSDRFGLTKQEQQRRRRDEMISSIGDAVTALGSMYFAKKDGVPVYDPTKSMTEATRKRYDRILTERRQAYNDYLAAERLRDMNDYRAKQLDARRVDQELRKWRLETDEKRINGTLDYKKEELAIKREHEENLKAYNEGRIDIAQYDSESRRIQAKAAWLRALKAGGGGNKQDYTTTVEKTDANGDTTSTTTTRTYGNSGGSQSQSRSGGGKGNNTTSKQPNPMGGSQNTSGKLPNPMG